MEPEIQGLIAKHRTELQAEREKGQDSTRYELPPSYSNKIHPRVDCCTASRHDTCCRDQCKFPQSIATVPEAAIVVHGLCVGVCMHSLSKR